MCGAVAVAVAVVGAVAVAVVGAGAGAVVVAVRDHSEYGICLFTSPPPTLQLWKRRNTFMTLEPTNKDSE